MYQTDNQYGEGNLGGAGTQTGSFGGHVFIVSPGVIRSFDTLAITAGSETENKSGGGEGFVARKNAKPKKVTMNVTLNAMLGCNPRSEMDSLTADAENGLTDYLYIGSEKLFPCLMMLTDANTSDVVTAPGGKWVSCKMALSFTQASRDNGLGEEKKNDKRDKDNSPDEKPEDPILKLKDEMRKKQAAQREIERQRALANMERAGNIGGGNAAKDRIILNY